MGFPVSLPRKAVGLLWFLGPLLLFVLGLSDHGRLKSAFIRCVLRGQPRERVRAWTQTFIQQLLTQGVFADALARIEQHRHENAHLVLMSASTDLYVPEVGQALGFHEVICTGVSWLGERLEGRLVSANRRGAEKTRCFRQLQAQHPGQVSAAYGNAGSDLEHLKLADQPLLVNASASARRRAAAMDVPVASHWQ